MAEGGVIEQEQRLSLTSGSEFVYDFYCELCWDDGLNEEADGFCVECKEYLCITCIHTHRKSRPTRHHDVLDKDSMPKDDPLPHDRVCKGISTKCKLHSKATVVFYCAFHDTLGCSECLLAEHRTCPDIESIDAKSEQILDSLEYKDLVRWLNDMEQKSRDMILKTRANVATTEINFSNAVEQIRKIREEVMVRLDDLELYLTTELEILTSEDKDKMRRMEEELLAFSEAVDQFKTDVQTLASSKRVCQLFIQIKTKKNEMSTLECNMRKVESEQMCARMFKFEPNNEISNVLTTTGLGKIVVQDRQSREAETSVAEDRRNIRDITTEHVSDTDIRYSGDRIKRVPRLGLVDCNPRTIDQTDQEVERDVHEKAPPTQQTQLSNNQSSLSGGGGRGHRLPSSQVGGVGAGTCVWNTVGGGRSTPFRPVDRSIDPSNICFSKKNVDASNIQLGPGGGASRFSGWGRGSTGGTSGGGATGGRPSQEKEKANTPANRFTVLNKTDSSRRYSGANVAHAGSKGRDWFDHPSSIANNAVTSSARGDSKGRCGVGRPPSLANRHSQETEREKALSAAKAIGDRPSAEALRERSRGRQLDVAERMTAPAAPAAKEFTSKEMKKKTNSILDEYLHIQDLKEVILCVEELSPNNHHHFVYHAINHVILRSQVARQKTGHLLHDLVKRNVISNTAYLKGLLEVNEFAEDMEIDIPIIWQYYGELISPMIQDGSIRLSFLKEVCQPLLASNKAGVLLAMVLKEARHREGHKTVADLWAESGLQWSEFVPKAQVGRFLKEYDLEFTKYGDSAPTMPTIGLPLTEIADKLHLLIVVQAADNETVFDWIESNVDEPTTKQATFIRALMTAVCNSAIKGDKGKERVEPKEINIRNDLLQKYLDHEPDSELQAMYALQVLVAKLDHPQGVLRQMFDTLYDEDIIAGDAFFQWEKSEEEPEGKGAALKQVVQFFQWLREADDDI